MTGLTVPTPKSTKQLMKLIDQDFKQRAYFVTGAAAAAMLRLLCRCICTACGIVLFICDCSEQLFGGRGHQRGGLQQHLLLC